MLKFGDKVQMNCTYVAGSKILPVGIKAISLTHDPRSRLVRVIFEGTDEIVELPDANLFLLDTESKLQELEAENKELKRRTSIDTDRMSELLREVEKEKSQTKFYYNLLNDSREVIKGKNQEIDCLNITIKDQRGKLRAFIDYPVKERMELENKELTIRVACLCEHIDHKNETIKELKATNENMLNEIDNLKEQECNLRKSLLNERKIVEDKKKDIDRLASNIIDHVNNAIEYREKINRLQTQVNSFYGGNKAKYYPDVESSYPKLVTRVHNLEYEIKVLRELVSYNSGIPAPASEFIVKNVKDALNQKYGYTVDKSCLGNDIYKKAFEDGKNETMNNCEIAMKNTG